MLLSALQITMREPTVAWRLLWQAPYSDVRHAAPHVKLMSNLIIGRWWRNGTRVPDGEDDFDAEVFRGVRASVRSCRGIVATCGV